MSSSLRAEPAWL